MEGRTIVFIWAVGLLLAAGLYLTGPELFLIRLLNAWNEIGAQLQDVIYLLGNKTFEAMRALAIALFVVFFALGVVAANRGIKARGALVLVSLLFLILLAGPGSGDPIRPSRWTEAFVLAAVGAVIMTQRLIRHD
jgi:hypothetical protein